MIRRLAIRVAAIALALGTAAAAPGWALEVPFLAGRVNDLADMLPDEAETRLEARLERLEGERGAQVAILTIASLEGEPLEDYSLRVAETWKLGRAEFDDGALLLIVRDDRKMRLEVGYGLEPAITDAMSRRILENLIRPRFREGDFAGGIEAGVDAIALLVEGEELPPPTESESGSGGLGNVLGFAVSVGFFSLLALGGRGCAAWLLFLILTPFWFTIPLAIWGRPLGLIPGILWVIGFPALWAMARRAGWGGRWTGGSGGGWSSSSGGWSGGGGFSSGGFSGGGGSFGGGGASSSW